MYPLKKAFFFLVSSPLQSSDLANPFSHSNAANHNVFVVVVVAIIIIRTEFVLHSYRNVVVAAVVIVIAHRREARPQPTRRATCHFRRTSGHFPSPNDGVHLAR